MELEPCEGDSVTGIRLRITTVADQACLKGNYKFLGYKIVVTGLFVFCVWRIRCIFNSGVKRRSVFSSRNLLYLPQNCKLFIPKFLFPVPS